MKLKRFILATAIGVFGLSSASFVAAQDDAGFQIQFIDALIGAGFKDYADKHMFDLEKNPAYKNSMQVAKARLLIAQRDIDGALAIAKKLGASKDADDIKLMAARYLIALGQNDRGNAIYKAYFDKYKTAPKDPSLKEDYQEAAFQYGSILERQGKYLEAVTPIQLAVKSGLPRGLQRRLGIKVANLFNLAAAEITDPKQKKKRDELATQAYTICEDIQFGGFDLYFGQSVGPMAQAQILLGKEDDAIKTLSNAKKDLQKIEGVLRTEGIDISKESPMASARYMLGEIHFKRAKQVLAKDGYDASKKHLQAAVNEYATVFKRYMSSDWGPQAGLKKQEILDIVAEAGGDYRDKGGRSKPVEITRDVFKVADNFYTAQKYDLAIENYLKVLSMYSDAEVAPYGINNLMTCYLKKKDDLMVKTVGKFAGDHWGNNDIAAVGLLNAGREFIGRKNPPMYLFLYDTFIYKFPDHKMTPQVIYTLAGLAAKDGFPEKEQEYLALITDKYSDSEFYIKTLSKTGYDLYNTEKYVRAAEELAKYIEVAKPGFDRAQAQFFLADSLYKQEKFAEAKKGYDTLIGWVRDPKGPYRGGPKEKELTKLLEDAFLFRALCLAGIKEPAEQIPAFREAALKNFELILKLYPKSKNAPKVLQAMGATYLGMDDTENAAASFNRIAKEFPDSAEAKNASFLIIDSLIKLGRLDEARAEFKKMMANSQLFTAEKFLLIGQKMLDREFYPEARQSFENVLKKSKDEDGLERARYGVGLSSIRMGDHENGIKVLSELIAESPNTGYFFDIKFLLGEAYRETGKFDEAKTAIGEASKFAKDPVNKKKVDLELCRLQMKQENYKGALASVSRVALFMTDTKNKDLRPIYKAILIVGVEAAEKIENWDEGISIIDTFKLHFSEDEKNMDRLQKLRRTFNTKKAQAI